MRHLSGLGAGLILVAGMAALALSGETGGEARPPFEPVSKVHDLMEINGDFSVTLRKEAAKENPDYKKVGEAARVIAEIGNVVQYHQPASEAQWWRLAGGLKQSGMEVDAAAAAQDPNALRQAIGKLGASCKACHDIYRKD